MKLKYTILAGVFAFASLTSCEMKDELLNKTEESSEVGYLNLGLAVDASSRSVTKANEATSTTPTVSATGFMVEVKKKGEEEAYKTFTYDGEEEPVELPVGDYTVYAHTSGNAENITTAPYYGKEESFSVKANEETGVNVVCTMMNMKIQLTYDNELKSTFKSWEISVTDGTHNKDFKRLETTADEDVQQPDPFYWMIADNVTTIKVEFSGVLKDNNTEIRESRSIIKPSSAGSQYWGAADALTVTIKPGEKDPVDPSGVTGIEISANLEWNTDGKTDNIEVPVEDSTTPSEPGGEEGDGDGEDGNENPTITSEFLESGINYTIKQNPDWVEGVDDFSTKYSVESAPEKAEVTISAPKGFGSIFVKIKAKGGFAAAAGVMGLTKGVDILSPDLNGTLKSLLNPPKEANETTYTLDIAAFFSMMAMYGPTGSDTYDFEITVTDKSGTPVGPTTLSVSISEVN